jgi:hypothetical protein
MNGLQKPHEKEEGSMRKSFVKLLAVCVALAVFAGGAFAAEVPQFKFGGGTSGGPWFVGVGGAVSMFNDKADDRFLFTYGASAGSVENARRMSTGEYDTGFCHVITLYEAMNGKGIFEGQPPADNLRVIAKVMDLTHIWVVLEDSGITNLDQLEGKKVNVGPPGSGGQVNSMYILDALGLDVDAQTLTFSGGARALADKQIDCTTGSAVPYTVPAITEIAQTHDINYLPVTQEQYDKVFEKLPFYQYIEIPAGVVKGVDEAVPAIAYSAYWMVVDTMPDEVVRAMLEIVMDPANNKILSSIQKNWAAVSGDLSGVAKMGIPVKKGAAEFWTERGVEIPEGMEID